ncbi:hypothetical protein FRX31_005362, partial [Thalictrum thalictroides]
IEEEFEHKINDVGPSNWLKEILRGTKFSGYLPPTPPKEQLLERYQSHFLNCSSCRMALKGLKALEDLKLLC